MADNEQIQVKQDAQPVKKRRFFRPRPKTKPVAEAAAKDSTEASQHGSKPQAKSKNPQKPSNEQAKQVKLQRPATKGDKPVAMAKANDKPKTASPKPDVQENAERRPAKHQRRFHKPKTITAKPDAKIAESKADKPVMKQAEPKVSQPAMKQAAPKADKPAAKQAEPKVNKPAMKQAALKADKPAVKQAEPKANKQIMKQAEPKANKPAVKRAEPMESKTPKQVPSEKPETSKHQLHKLASASQPAHKTTVKTNSTFKAHKPKGNLKPRLSDIDFRYLDTTDFKDIYALVTNAQSYFAEDKGTCCAKFRIANEAIIERLIKDLQLEEVVAKKELSTNYFEQINLLAKNIPEDMVEGNVFAEMHNIRMIGNSFAHGDDKYDADRGSKTCLIAMEKICQWLIVFEPKYLSYQRAKNMTKSNFFSDIWNGILSIFKFK